MKLKLYSDNIICGLAVGYILLPICLFLIGWARFPIAVIGCGLLIWLGIQLRKDFQETSVSITNNKRFWLVSLGAIALWALFSGIGNFSYQTTDFRLRNAMFRDLCTYGYPVIYDLHNEPELIRNFIGDASSGMCVYYLTWWLPAAYVAKFLNLFTLNFSIVYSIANVCLYLWTVLGLFLIFYCLVRYFNKYSYWILLIFILFSGLDIVVYLIENTTLPYNHIEWLDGAGLWQYSANTTQLYWVFNQSIPVWLITILLVMMTRNNRMGAWGSLAFAYSPFATIGLVPVCLFSMFCGKSKFLREKIKSAVSFENISVILMMLIVYGSFYALVLGNASADNGFIFSIFPEFRTVTLYAFFILLEVLIYFLVMGKGPENFNLYWIIFVELLLIPLYRMGDANDFCMRASIAPLFLLMMCCIQYLFDEKKTLRRRRILTVCLLIGFFTSFTEIQRNISGTLTMQESDYIVEDIYSLGNMQLTDTELIETHLNQYMSFDNVYEESFFYKYICQK